MNIKWEKITTEKELEIHKDVKISVEKEGSDIKAVFVSFGNRKLKITKGSDYSSALSILKMEEPQKEKKWTVVANKGSSTLQCTENSLKNAEDKKTELEYEGWKAEIVETEEYIKIDIISGKQEGYGDGIPF